MQLQIWRPGIAQYTNAVVYRLMWLNINAVGPSLVLQLMCCTNGILPSRKMLCNSPSLNEAAQHKSEHQCLYKGVRHQQAVQHTCIVQEGLKTL